MPNISIKELLEVNRSDLPMGTQDEREASEILYLYPITFEAKLHIRSELKKENING
jgi:hypothetical protein